METIYRTKEWKGYGKSYYWNEYRSDGKTVEKIKCSRHKFFDGNENTWGRDEEKVDSWSVKDKNKPEWLEKYL